MGGKKFRDKLLDIANQLRDLALSMDDPEAKEATSGADENQLRTCIWCGRMEQISTRGMSRACFSAFCRQRDKGLITEEQAVQAGRMLPVGRLGRKPSERHAEALAQIQHVDLIRAAAELEKKSSAPSPSPASPPPGDSSQARTSKQRTSRRGKREG